MRKEIKYQLTNKQFILIEVAGDDEVEIIIRLNNEFDKDKKKERTYQRKTVLLSQIEEGFHVEIVDEDENILRIYEENERKKIIVDAIKKLTPRQRQVIVAHFYNDKSLRRIARENQLAYSTIYGIYHAALAKLRKKLSFFKD